MALLSRMPTWISKDARAKATKAKIYAIRCRYIEDGCGLHM